MHSYGDMIIPETSDIVMICCPALLYGCTNDINPHYFQQGCWILFVVINMGHMVICILLLMNSEGAIKLCTLCAMSAMLEGKKNEPEALTLHAEKKLPLKQFCNVEHVVAFETCGFVWFVCTCPVLYVSLYKDGKVSILFLNGFYIQSGSST